MTTGPATARPPVRAVLWGRDHVDYDMVATLAVGDAVGLALTRGRHPKPYAWVDPNEDAVAAVDGPRATLLVVADGHNGAQSAEVAVATVLDRFGDDPPPEPDEAELLALFADAGRDVLRATRDLPLPHRESRTTLTVAFVTSTGVSWAALGDSALFVAGAAGARELSTPHHLFVGHPLSSFVLRDRLDRGRAAVAAGDRVVVTSDGFTNFAVADEPATAVGDVLAGIDGPVDAAADLVAHAADGGAGDNVAVAVAVVGGR